MRVSHDFQPIIILNAGCTHTHAHMYACMHACTHVPHVDNVPKEEE